ncbi:hypothetical protein RRG08_059185 [Elysia crispata]|uniref:Uncharacterized protein n=1 Tax=Elysia crispata TaxID=231223 RepID=A0AAE0ZEI6_9GAST|nr:hypothetical protein RRG08_059185 [Elysia crispata]
MKFPSLGNLFDLPKSQMSRLRTPQVVRLPPMRCGPASWHGNVTAGRLARGQQQLCRIGLTTGLLTGRSVMGTQSDMAQLRRGQALMMFLITDPGLPPPAADAAELDRSTCLRWLLAAFTLTV